MHFDFITICKKNSVCHISDNNSKTCSDNSESETELPDFSTPKPFDMEPRKKVSDENCTEYKCQTNTFCANRGLAIAAGLNVVGFVSLWKQRKKNCVARTIPKFQKKIMYIK